MPNYNEKALELIRTAIGNRTQKEFAEQAGISQYLLSRALTNKFNTATPRRSTLQAIANASEGRVTYEELIEACGYTFDGQEKVPPNELKSVDQAENASMATAVDLCEGLSKLAGYPVRYDSLKDFAETVTMLYSNAQNESFKIVEEKEYDSKRGDHIAHCMFKYMRSGWRFTSYVYFSLVYHVVSKGVVVSDAICDLQSLVDLGHPSIHGFIFRASQRDDIEYANFPVAHEIVEETESMQRLLRAIYGDFPDGEISDSEDETEEDDKEFVNG